MPLTPAQIQAYDSEGFVVCPRLVPNPLIDCLNHELDEIEAKALTLAAGRGQISWQDYFQKEASNSWAAIHLKDYYRPGFENCRIYKIQEAMEFCPAAKAIALCSEVVAPVGELIGDCIGVNHSKIQFKEAVTGPPQPWHQDSWYFDCDSTRVLTAVIYLDDASHENGALQVLAGSHRMGMLHHDDGVLNDPRADISQATLCGGPAGSAVFFHALCAHGSDRNTSTRRRRALVLHYYPQDLIWGIEGRSHDATFVPVQAGGSR